MPAPEAMIDPFVTLTRDGEVCVAHPAPPGTGEEHAFALYAPAAARAHADLAEVIEKHVAGVRTGGAAVAFTRGAPPAAWEPGRLIDADHTADAVAALTKSAPHVWAVAGVGRLFASTEAPPSDDRVTRIGGTAAAPVAKVYTTRILKDSPGADQQLVTGIVLEPETVDSQGDIYSADEIARAAHGFMADFQNLGFMHRTLVNNAGRIVESYVTPCDFELGGQHVKAGTWLMTIKITNEALWKQIKAGDLTGLSIGGFAQRVAP